MFTCHTLSTRALFFPPGLNQEQPSSSLAQAQLPSTLSAVSLPRYSYCTASLLSLCGALSAAG